MLTIAGVDYAGQGLEVNLAAADTQAANPAFDVTPARLVRGLVTEHGVFEASEAGLTQLQGRL